MLILKYSRAPENCPKCIVKRKQYFKQFIDRYDDRQVIIKLIDECTQDEVVEMAKYTNELLRLKYGDFFILKVVDHNGVEIE